MIRFKSLFSTKSAATVFVSLNIVAMAMILASFQNCSQARFAMAGNESAKNTGLGDGPITPDDPQDPNDPDDPNNPNPPGNPNDPNNPDHPGCDHDDQYVECGPEILINGDFEFVDSRKGLVSDRALNTLANIHDWDVYATLPGSGLQTATANSLSDVSWYAEDGTAGIEVQGGLVYPAASGKLSIELDSHPNSARGSKSNSGMYQIVNLSADSKYVLKFSYRGRGAAKEDNRIDVFVGDQKIRSVAAVPSQTWQKVAVNVQINKGLRKILFRANGTQSTIGGLLDQASLRKLCLKK